ncbi:MAG: response regulator [Victivallales bacterium]|nr:response regulator [Victivallales bacterium]
MSSSKVHHTNLPAQAAIFTLLFACVLVLLCCVVRINSVILKQSLNYNNHLRYHIANDCFRQGTDALTEAVRRYVVTMKPEYREDYFNEAENERHRDIALEMVKDLPIDQALKQALYDAHQASKQLMFTEYHAMHLVEDNGEVEIMHKEISEAPLTAEEHRASLEQRHALAEELLWDDLYIETKHKIYSYLLSGLESASASATARHHALRNELFTLLFISVCALVVLVITIFGCLLARRIQHERLVEEQARETALMNEQLKEERDKSIKAEKAKSYFFSTVSHDIRTPLNAIIGFSEMLQLGIEDKEDKEKALEAIVTSGQTLLELINDVLDLSKLEAGKMELHPVPTDITSLIKKVATSFEVATSRTSVPLSVEIQQMPFLQLDPQRIRQILFNLIGNAVKFTSKGSITIRASYENGTFSMSVSDTGCGISDENLKKLMSPYVQIHDKNSSMGTGLGLAICKQLATQMHGTMEIKSTLGKGSVFTLRVPNVIACENVESEKNVEENSKVPKLVKLEEALTEKNILVVDDQKLNQSILRTMLSRLGFRNVLVAGNGAAALEIMKSAGNVDIVLTDMFMPVLDGEGLVREIRKTPELAKIPVYVITADVEMQGEYKAKGFDNMLLKPITIDKLQDLLTQYTPHES